ncbi:DUF2939 domain-containing protein [uncultured Thiodictyon sp.]|uniref:DUF2939 domain-containing protein n=1 Tax=uncultured Thiodictyon sp. TaxID=1846217 RepID=UPI0025F5D92B|nr:DUF2939 domain-containing protein [uncultured Thiodictyon sp.]
MRQRPAADTLRGAVVGGRRRRIAHALAFPALIVIAYLVWPFITLWQLDRALVRGDQAALGRLVDLDAVRDALRRKLNKDAIGTIGPLSDAFITWLEEGIRRDGTAALDQAVTLEWVRERMLAHSPSEAGLWPALSRVRFDDPLYFSLRLGGESQVPVTVRIGFTGLSWRVRALYY